MPLTVSPKAVQFGKVAIGATSKPKVLKVVNSKRNPSVTVTVTNSSFPTDFNFVNSCPSSLAPGESCKVDVTFTPSSAVSEFNLLAIRGSQNAPLTGIELRGTGIIPKTKK